MKEKKKIKRNLGERNKVPSFFDKVKKKTNIDKDTIISMAQMINDNGLKDEKTLRMVIRKLSLMTGKDVSNELEDKIITTIKEDKVPKNVEGMF